MAKVRILWVGYSSKPDYAHSKVISNLRSLDQIEFCVATGVKRHSCDDQVLSEPLLLHHDLLFAKYEKEIKHFSPMIDQNLSQKFSSFEGETLRMMDRLHGRGPNYRFFDNFDTRRAMFFKHCSFWYEYLRTKRISHVVFNGVPHEVFTFVLYQIAVAQSLNSIILTPEKTGRPRKVEGIFLDHESRAYTMHTQLFFVSSSLEDIGTWSLSGRIKLVEGNRFQTLSTGDPFKNISVEVVSSDESKLIKTGIISFIKSQSELFSSVAKRPFEIKRFLKNARTTRRQFKEHTKLSKVNRFDVPSVLFCLSYQPEESSSPRAGIFVEQGLGIRAVLRALPTGWKLRVREHPDQYGRGRPRPIGFLHELSKISNVEIVPIDEDVEKSFESARVVVASAGTMCFEAWNRDIPLFLLGHMLLKKAPGVKFVESISDLEIGFKGLLAGDVPSSSCKDDFKKWTASHSYVGNLQKIKNPELFRDTVANLTGVLERWIALTS